MAAMHAALLAFGLGVLPGGCLPAGGRADSGSPEGNQQAGPRQAAVIAFPSGAFTPPAGERVQPSLLRAARGKGSRRPTCALLLLEGGISEGLRRELEHARVTLFGAYPDAAYKVELPLEAVPRAAELRGVGWIGRPTPEQKAARELLPLVRGEAVPPEPRQYHVHLYSPRVWERARGELARLPARVERYEPSIGVALITADAQTLRRVLELDTVLYVEPLGEVKAGAGR